VLDIDGLLRGKGRHAVGGGAVPWVRLVAILLGAGALYGAVMGSYGGLPAQSATSAAKVPLLVVVASLVCLPNFYVVNLVLGLGGDFRAAFRGILSAQATFAVCLASLSPITALCYATTSNYHMAKLANAAMFALALLGAQQTLARHYRPLVAKNARHRVALLAWPALYFFVAAQFAYVLRPYIGNPAFPAEFLRTHWWGNVYVDLWWSVQGALR